MKIARVKKFYSAFAAAAAALFLAGGIPAVNLDGLLAVKADAATVGAFSIVTNGVDGTDYSYTSSVLTIMSDEPITIANTDPDVSTTDSIEVAGGINADITLAGVNIDVTAVDYAVAFKIADDSTGDVTITAKPISDDDVTVTLPTDVINAGEKTVTVTGIGSYKGEAALPVLREIQARNHRRDSICGQHDNQRIREEGRALLLAAV